MIEVTRATMELEKPGKVDQVNDTVDAKTDQFTEISEQIEE